MFQRNKSGCGGFFKNSCIWSTLTTDADSNQFVNTDNRTETGPSDYDIETDADTFTNNDPLYFTQIQKPKLELNLTWYTDIEIGTDSDSVSDTELHLCQALQWNLYPLFNKWATPIIVFCLLLKKP